MYSGYYACMRAYRTYIVWQACSFGLLARSACMAVGLYQQAECCTLVRNAALHCIVGS